MHLTFFVLFCLIGFAVTHFEYSIQNRGNGPYGDDYGSGGNYGGRGNYGSGSGYGYGYGYESDSSSSSSSESASEENACSTCSKLFVKTGSETGVDEKITQTIKNGANGCKKVVVTCTAATAGTEVNFFFSNDETDLGTASATTTIKRNFFCNANGELVLKENGASAVVNKVECISARLPPACTTCGNIQVKTKTGSGDDEPITQMAGTDVHGCKTVKITCTTAKVGEEVIFFFSNGAVDLGTASGTTTVSRILTCDENAKFLLTDGENTRAVGSVECITARAPPVCTTCGNIQVKTKTGSGDDEPITQMAGTDVHGCKTVKITCTTAKVGEEVIFFFSNGAIDLGTASGTTTVSRILTCDENAKFLLTDGENTRAVGSVECITAATESL